VFYGPDGVYRALSSQGLADWQALTATHFFPDLVAAGKVVETEVADSPGIAPALPAGEAAGVLRHAPIPFVSYPYEWPFGMLKDAALLQLELLAAALAEGMILKDSSPYNVQWRGSRAVFVDVGSFEPLRNGEPWIGYRQFCMLFLYPLLLQARRGIDFHPWLRGSLEGITPEQCRRALPVRQLARRGVFSHVYLHSKLERRYGDRRDVKGELRGAGFRKELIEANVNGLRRLVTKLDWSPERSVWTEYGSANTYSESDTERKAAFVRAVASERRWSLAWDLGCNDGRYSRIAADGSDYVVAVDGDEGPVEQLYQALKEEGETRIMPLTLDLADPSPALGWRGLERKALPERGRPDLVLCLALVHHICISANVPVLEFLDWLHELGCALVVEFVGREDPMVERLMSGKRAGSHPDYERAFFERCLSDAFEVVRSETLSSGTRTLYYARPRGVAGGHLGRADL